MNSTAGQTYTVTTGTITRGNGVGAINYNGPGLLSLYASSAGNNTINIQSTSAPTYIATSLLSLFTSSPGLTRSTSAITAACRASRNRRLRDEAATPVQAISSTSMPMPTPREGVVDDWRPSFLAASGLGEYSSISIGGSAAPSTIATRTYPILPDTPGLPANVASIQTPYTVDNSALTTIITGSQGQDAVLFDVTAAAGLGTQTPAVLIDDNTAIATAQFNVGLVYSQQVAFDPVTDVSVTGGSFEVNGPVTAADAYVSSGFLTVDAGQTLDVSSGDVVLNGGVTQIATGAVDDAGDFTQSDDSDLGINLTNGMPTPVTGCRNGFLFSSGELNLTALAGFAPSSGQVITLIQN